MRGRIKFGSIPDRSCIYCGEMYTPKNESQKYCSKGDCQKRAHREQNDRWKAETAAGKRHGTNPSGLKCILCDHTYSHCKCTCTRCGSPKWGPDPRWPGEWKHHVCNKGLQQ